MRSLLSLLILAVGTSLAMAEPGPSFRIVGDTQYPPHTLVRLRAEGVDPKAALLWRVDPANIVQRATTAKNLLEFAAPPGRYVVELLVVVVTPDGEFRIDEARQTITVGTRDPVPPPGAGKLDPEKALGRIRFGNAGCTATVIGPRRADGHWDVLTAAHCISGVGQRGTLTLTDGRSFGIRSVAQQKTADVTWCVTEDEVADLPYAVIAEKNPDPGTAVWHRGFGIDQPGNREEGAIAERENNQGQLRMILSVSSGDSGGGIFRADTNELVAVVCCTSGMAQKVSMWGCSAEMARKTRPQPTSREETWVPLPIPICQGPATPKAMPTDDGWKPVPIPIRSR